MEINLPDKLYYSIGEVAKAFGVNTSLIRFWEKEFAIISQEHYRISQIYPRRRKKTTAYLSSRKRKRFYFRRCPTTIERRKPKNAFQLRPYQQTTAHKTNSHRYQKCLRVIKISNYVSVL